MDTMDTMDTMDNVEQIIFGIPITIATIALIIIILISVWFTYKILKYFICKIVYMNCPKCNSYTYENTRTKTYLNCSKCDWEKEIL